MKDLGWINGWKEEPAIVTQCRQAREDELTAHGLRAWDKCPSGHNLESSNSWERCVSRITCPTCGYTYAIDSSD